MSKTLLAYFSAGGATKTISENLAHILDADIYEIKPKIPYTDKDLDWTDNNSRSTLEMKDKNSRPEIIDDEINISDYDTIFLGFPIWWYIAPTIINTFLEKHDFSNKKIVLYATSGGSGFGNTVANLKKSAPSANFIEGKILKASMSNDELKNWILSIK